jgi:hypothetical protein
VYVLLRSVTFLAVVVVGLSPLHAQRRGPQLGFPALETSEDVAYLERVASSMQEAEAVPGGRRGIIRSAPKDARLTAYARLGELATPESLAAVARIESAARKTPLLPATVRLGLWSNASFHSADTDVKPLAQAKAEDGTTYALLSGNLLGPTRTFLTWTKTPDDPSSWSRPIPTALGRPTAQSTLAFRDKQTLVVGGVEGAPGETVLLLPQTRKDSDSDGWTDLEEELLGLDPMKRDTDGDGVADGEDQSPDQPFASDAARSEQEQMIQAAVFASFGLSGSRMVIRVDPRMEKLPFWGYPGPILYKSPQQPAGPGNPLMSFSWMVRQVTDTEAVVTVYDSFGAGMLGSQQLNLRKTGERWYVVGRGRMAAS